MMIAELEAQIADLEAKIAEAEATVAALVLDAGAVKREWRAAALAADADGDVDAAGRARALEQSLTAGDLARERAQLLVDELRSRKRTAEAALDRYVVAERRMKYFRRKPKADGFGPMSNWAAALRGLVPIGNDGGWESVSEDRVRYEISRGHPQPGDAWRALRSGQIVHCWDWDLRAQVDE